MDYVQNEMFQVHALKLRPTSRRQWVPSLRVLLHRTFARRGAEAAESARLLSTTLCQKVATSITRDRDYKTFVSVTEPYIPNFWQKLMLYLKQTTNMSQTFFRCS